MADEAFMKKFISSGLKHLEDRYKVFVGTAARGAIGLVLYAGYLYYKEVKMKDYIKEEITQNVSKSQEQLLSNIEVAEKKFGDEIIKTRDYAVTTFHQHKKLLIHETMVEAEKKQRGNDASKDDLKKLALQVFEDRKQHLLNELRKEKQVENALELKVASTEKMMKMQLYGVGVAAAAVVLGLFFSRK